MANFSPALFKTVREIALEQKVADLERALMRQKYGREQNIYYVPETTELTMDAAPPRITLPLAASVRALYDENSPHHVKVAAVVTIPQPFGLNYYCDLALLADLSIATQVLGMLHERFIHQLADLIGQTGDIPISNKKAPTASPRVPSTS